MKTVYGIGENANTHFLLMVDPRRRDGTGRLTIIKFDSLSHVENLWKKISKLDGKNCVEMKCAVTIQDNSKTDGINTAICHPKNEVDFLSLSSGKTLESLKSSQEAIAFARELPSEGAAAEALIFSEESALTYNLSRTLLMIGVLESEKKKVALYLLGKALF